MNASLSNPTTSNIKSSGQGLPIYSPMENYLREEVRFKEVIATGGERQIHESMQTTEQMLDELARQMEEHQSRAFGFSLVAHIDC